MVESNKGVRNNLVIHLFLIALLGLLVYSNTFHAPFVWDDIRLLVENPFIKNIRYSADLLSSNSENETKMKDAPGLEVNYGNSRYDRYQLYKTIKQRYIGHLSLVLNYRLGGFNVEGYHIVNLSIHIGTAFVLYFFMLLTLQTPMISDSKLQCYQQELSFIIALLFAVHPVQTGAVTYVYARFVSLVTFFYLSAMVAYIRWRIAEDTVTQADIEKGAYSRLSMKHWAWFAGSLVSIVLAMKTKENAITIPVAIVMYEFVFFSGDVRKRLLRLVPILMTLAIIPYTFFMEMGMNPAQTYHQSDFMRYNAIDYFYTQLRVIITYIRLLFFPVNQVLDYAYPMKTSLFDFGVMLSLLFHLSVVCLALWLLCRSKKIDSGWKLTSFGILLFYLGLSIECSIIPTGLLYLEYRLYLPSAGFIIALVSAYFLLMQNFVGRIRTQAIFLPLFLCITVLASTAYLRNEVWGDEITLWEDNIKKAPDRYVPYFNLSVLYMNKGRYEDAYKILIAAMRHNPPDIMAHKHFGIYYDETGQFDKAAAEFLAILKIDPDDASAYNDLGVTYSRSGRFEDAVAAYNKALSLNPEFIDAYNNLGVLYDEHGRGGEALKIFESALKIMPEDIKTHENLGIAYFHAGEFENALKEFNFVLKFEPNSAEASRYAARIYEKRGVR